MASIFNAFGSRIHLVEIAPRILMSEDHEVSEAVTAAMAASGVQVVADAGTIDRFERCATGVRLIHLASDGQHSIDAALAVVAAGWVAATAGLDLDQAGVQTDRRGSVQVDAQLRTTVPHIFAAGDVTGRALVVHEAVREGLVAATNAVLGATTVLSPQVSPIGSFTDPEYASVGLTRGGSPGEAPGGRGGRALRLAPTTDHRWPPDGVLQAARRPRTPYDSGLPRRGGARGRVAQLAATAMAAKMPVEELALVPFSFPTYANALGRVAVLAAIELDHTGMWAVDHLETAVEAGVA